MRVFPFEQLNKMRPDWSVVYESGLTLLAPGETQQGHFHDQVEYLFVLEGKCEFEVRDERDIVSAGSLVLVGVGERHAIVSVLEPTVILWLRDEPQAPFRIGLLDPASAVGVPAFPPKRPLPTPGRRAHVVCVEADRTFSPELLAGPGGGDIVLELNLANLGEMQSREIRGQANRNLQTVAAVALKVADAEIETFLFDRFVQMNMDIIDPANLAVALDPADPAQRPRLDKFRQHWFDKLRMAHCGLCLDFTMRPWTDEETVQAMQTLMTLPPAHWGLALRWNQRVLRRDAFRIRAQLQALLPWLRLVRCPADTVQEIAHYLDGLGFQGWVAKDE